MVPSHWDILIRRCRFEHAGQRAHHDRQLVDQAALVQMQEVAALDATSRKPIAVVGATGLQGGATVRALLGANAPVRALARRTDSAAARALTELGADLVAADLDDPEGLRAAFTGVDGVFAMTTPGYDQRTDLEVAHGHAIADAAAAANVPHVIYSSVGGAERHTGIPHFDSKRDVEEVIGALATVAPASGGSK